MDRLWRGTTDGKLEKEGETWVQKERDWVTKHDKITKYTDTHQLALTKEKNGKRGLINPLLFVVIQQIWIPKMWLFSTGRKRSGQEQILTLSIGIN